MNEPRDLLDEAISAYSDSADSELGATEARVAMATRGRVLAELRAKEQRSRKFRFWGIPIALGLVGSTTWAAESPWVQELSTVVASKAAEWSAVALGTQSSASRPRPPASPSKPASVPGALPGVTPTVAPAPAPSEVATPALALVPPPALPVAPARPKPIRGAPSAVQTRGPEVVPESVPRIPSGLADYELAHGLHFRQGDCHGAVAAYRRYIDSFPTGAFVLEAQYNLGLCLSRLGRTDEAVRVLIPFASGSHGSYRQKESQAIVDALQGQPPARE